MISWFDPEGQIHGWKKTLFLVKTHNYINKCVKNTTYNGCHNRVWSPTNYVGSLSLCLSPSLGLWLSLSLSINHCHHSSVVSSKLLILSISLFAFLLLREQFHYNMIVIILKYGKIRNWHNHFEDWMLTLTCEIKDE